MPTEINADFLVSIALQLPLLVLFIWYNDRMLRRFDERQDKRDKEFLDSIKLINDALHAHDDRVDQRIAAARDSVTVPRVKR